MPNIITSALVKSFMETTTAAGMRGVIGVDLAAPGPIGGTTPGAGTFTTLVGDSLAFAASATNVADFSSLTKSGTSTNSAAIIGKSLGLTENLWVGGAIVIKTTGDGDVIKLFNSGTVALFDAPLGSMLLRPGGQTALTLAVTSKNATFASATAGTSTTAAAILGKSMGLTENLWVGGTGHHLGAIIIPSTNTLGLQAYNTADEVTNFERVELVFASNVAHLRTIKGGSGTLRNLSLNTGTGSPTVLIRAGGSSGGALTFQSISTAGAGDVGFVFSNYASTATSGSSIGLHLTPTYNQASGTAANTDLLVNRTETAIGSGAQLLMDLQVGGVSKFKVNNLGAITATAAATLRITQRVQSVADAATITPNADADDFVDITAIAQAFTIANPSGTPTNGQALLIRIKDSGGARGITWGSAYFAGGVALPSTTVSTKILTLGFVYNTANSLNKFQLVSAAQEA